MKERLLKAAVVALSALTAASSSASASIRESVTFSNVPSMDAQGDVDNVKQQFTLTGGYTMSALHITGVITNPNATNSRPNQCRVRAKRPDNVFITIPLSAVPTQVLGTPVALASATMLLDGFNPAGNWEFEFYETTDNLANGADLTWSSVTFDFEDNLGGPTGADVRLCQLYGLYMPVGSRTGSTVGLALGTTSWNIGTRNLMWSAEPDSRHPFIVGNMYRLLGDRFEQIGMSWVKHGFFALSDTQCGGMCNPTSGNFLGVGCTDTYDPGLNADQSGLGPRNEVNPWMAHFTYPGSVYATQGGAPTNVARRLQVQDSDLDQVANAGAQYYFEGVYFCREDTDVMNSAAWKPVTSIVGSPGNNWSFGQSGAGTQPTVGFAADAWPGAQKVTLAQEVPVNQATSPDGRCVLYSKVSDNGNGTYHYEYALLNVDMARQVGDFVIACPAGVTVTNIGFHAPRHHEETLNLPLSQGGVPIDNSPWTGTRESDAVRWSTSTNPLRWGTLYNFRFDADAAPFDGQVSLNMFTPGAVTQVVGTTRVPEPPAPPEPCAGDADGNGIVNFADITSVLTNFGADYTPGTGAGDADHNGPVNFADITSVLTNYSVPCPS